MTPPSHLLGSSAITENLLKRKWSVRILRHLESGVTDPEEINRLEEDLSAAVMNERLRTMVRYCLIARCPRAGRPKSADYVLTAKGRRILRMLELISKLDEFSDQDPRSLEEILRNDLAARPVPPVIIPDPVPEKPSRGRSTRSAAKSSSVRILKFKTS